jgi:catalase
MVPPGESAAISQIVETSLRMLDTTARPVPRAQHAKTQAYLWGYFRVHDDVEPKFRIGIFSRPRTFAAIVRVSNGKQLDDRKPDAHGLAIKLFQVEGDKPYSADPDAETQDFVLVDNPTFFISNAKNYSAFSTVFLSASKKPPITALLTLASHYFWRHPIEFLTLISFVGKKPKNLLQSSFHSTTPYSLDGAAVKYKAEPTGPTPAESARASEDSANLLRDALRKTLATREARYTFAIQPQVDSAQMPVENPTKRWSESLSPPRPVATLVIPPQDIDSAERLAEGDDLSFNPWHCLDVHRPIGGVNRTRLAVYNTLAARRRELNNTSQSEPSIELWRRWSGVDAPRNE